MGHINYLAILVEIVCRGLLLVYVNEVLDSCIVQRCSVFLYQSLVDSVLNL
jgi:hypothetical protein